MNTALTALLQKIDELAEAYDAISEGYYDTLAEYRGEVARYGDAWAGAKAQIDRGREATDTAHAALMDAQLALALSFPVLGPPAPVEDEPF